MSIKTGSLKLNGDGQWTRTPSLDANIKFAGEEAKDRLYEPKHKKKLVRVLTVIAYLFLVSLAAIMLSLYYVFLWNGSQRENARIAVVKQPSHLVQTKCDITLETVTVQQQQQPRPGPAILLEKLTRTTATAPPPTPAPPSTSPTPSPTGRSSTWPDYDYYVAKLHNYTLTKKLVRKRETL